MSLSVLNRQCDTMLPTKVITIFENKDHTYIEWAPVKDMIPQASMPLSYDTLKDIFSFISQEELTKYKFKSIIPKNVIYYDNNVSSLKLIWYVKGKIASYLTKNKEDTLYYPNLLFMYNNRQMYIYSFIDNVVTNDTKLYKAPFPNIYEDNSMCFGNMNIDKFIHFDLEKTMLSLTDSFFNSKFNEYMSGNRTDHNTDNIFKRILNKDIQFPIKELVALNKTVKSLLNDKIR